MTTHPSLFRYPINFFAIRGAQAGHQSHFDADGRKEKKKKPSRTIVPGSLEDAHALCDCCASEPLIIRRVDSRQERNVDTKGLVCLALRFANGLAQRIGIGLGQRREDTYVSVWAP
jgi:hypothetical protein